LGVAFGFFVVGGMTGGEVTTGAAVAFSATGLSVLATGGGVIGFAVTGTGGSVTVTGGGVTGGVVIGSVGDTVETGTGAAVGGIDIAER
jgi:hypothetical protein